MNWIWPRDLHPDRNAFVCFRRTFSLRGPSEGTLKITADSRYTLYANGRYVRFGPVPDWPAHWKYDEYDLSPYLAAELRLAEGPARRGGAAKPRILKTDRHWKARICPSSLSRAHFRGRGRRPRKTLPKHRPPPAARLRAGREFILRVLPAGNLGRGRTRSRVSGHHSPGLGLMIDEGASTFWEMWSLSKGRLTRSHCHGWSAAPVFFLSSTVLGVRPVKPGYAEIEFHPRPGDLAFMRGRIPTPHGVVEVSGRRKGKRWLPSLRLPPGVQLRRGAKNTV